MGEIFKSAGTIIKSCVFLFITIVIIIVLVKSCIGSNKTYTLSELADKNTAVVGTLNIPYTMPTGGGFSAIDIEKFETHKIGDNDFTNVVDFKLYGDKQYIKDFVKEKAYFDFLDEHGKEITDISPRIGDNGDYVSVILDSEKDLKNINDVKYLLVGGFEPDKNDGKSKIIFEVK